MQNTSFSVQSQCKLRLKLLCIMCSVYMNVAIRAQSRSVSLQSDIGF